MLMRTAAAVLAIGLAYAGPALANDSSAELAAGGLVFIQNPNVEMASEELFVSPPEIRVTYHFFNKSDQDVTNLVAFPMPDITFASEDTNLAIPTADPQNFLGFSTKVNGKPVTAQIEQKVFAKGVDQTALLQQLGIPGGARRAPQGQVAAADRSRPRRDGRVRGHAAPLARQSGRSRHARRVWHAAGNLGQRCRRGGWSRSGVGRSRRGRRSGAGRTERRSAATLPRNEAASRPALDAEDDLLLAADLPGAPGNDCRAPLSAERRRERRDADRQPAIPGPSRIPEEVLHEPRFPRGREQGLAAGGENRQPAIRRGADRLRPLDGSQLGRADRRLHADCRQGRFERLGQLLRHRGGAAVSNPIQTAPDQFHAPLGPRDPDPDQAADPVLANPQNRHGRA